MAMNKKEKAEFDAVILKAETLAALRWTEKVEPDLPIPEWNKSTSGWKFNSYSKSVSKMWSEGGSHGSGDGRRAGYCASQQGIRLYSTKALALKAMRYEVELAAARDLLRIDKMIQDEIEGLD
jgi:hypothetical protein